MSKSLQIRIDDVVGFYTGLVRALGENGIGGNKLNEIFTAYQWAECVQCGIKITGEEMDQILVADEETKLPHPKLQRLRLGYCAREGCESYDYCIHFEDYPGLDWSAVAEKAVNEVTASKVVAELERKQKIMRKRQRRMKQAALALFTVLVLLLLRTVIQHDHQPFGRKPHKYEIDPGSVSHLPSR
jgi:predicted nucleic acid-binding Zn ribbon protein